MGSINQFFKSVKWFLFKPSIKPNMEDYTSVYDKIVELASKISLLEQENIEITNTLYKIQKRLDSTSQNQYTLKNFTLGDS